MIAINRNYGRQPRVPPRRPVDAVSSSVNMIYDPGPAKAAMPVVYDTGKSNFFVDLPSIVVNMIYDTGPAKTKAPAVNDAEQPKFYYNAGPKPPVTVPFVYDAGSPTRIVDAPSMVVNMIYDTGPAKALAPVVYDTEKSKIVDLPGMVVNMIYDTGRTKPKGGST